MLVGNPTAQSGRNAERIVHARVLMDRAGLDHAFLPTLPDGKTVGAVADGLRDGAFDTVVYMGGDGTFAEVAKGLLASERAASVRLGMLPTGTANDQGKSFGLEARDEALERNVDVLVMGFDAGLDAGRITAIDETGHAVRDDWFFDSAGWGIGPRVLALRNEDRKLIQKLPIVRDVFRDQMVYAGALLRTFVASYRDDDSFDVDVSVDGRTVAWRGLTDLIVKGTRIYGGLWVFDPDSRADDGVFEIVPFVGRADWLSKAIVHLDATGNVNDSLSRVGVTHSAQERGGRIELTLRPHDVPLRAQIDGEEFPATPSARIEVQPRALRVIVPEEFSTARNA
jgi:diacylglycerol kinase family enzyme